MKKEITASHPQGPCCITAACYGIACFGKYFDARGLVLHTENAFIAQWAKSLFAQSGIAGKVYVKARPSRIYEFKIGEPYEVEKMLALFSHTGEETSLRIRRENINCHGCFAAFVAAAFLCCGVIVDPAKRYALEFVSSRYPLMRDFEALLAEQGFTPKLTVRNGVNVLYFKASEQIEDLLTTMGASEIGRA
ncbi:MAG: DNA-binding protein WhiA, partial [Oscillospiraceae bacterium]